jgi:hypothetical protein
VHKLQELSAEQLHARCAERDRLRVQRDQQTKKIHAKYIKKQGHG